MYDYITADEMKENNIEMLKAARDGYWDEAFAWQASLWCDALYYAVDQNNEDATLECLEKWIKQEYVDDEGKFERDDAICQCLQICAADDKNDLLEKMCIFLEDFAKGTRYERANFCSNNGIDLLITEETMKHLFDYVLEVANHYKNEVAQTILKKFGADTEEKAIGWGHTDLFDVIYDESFEEALERMENREESEEDEDEDECEFECEF